MKWFKHESNANMDAKLKRLKLKYGMEGYGLYWYCLELIAQSVDKNNLTFELEHDSEIISSDVQMHFEKVQEMMQYMVHLNLFEGSMGRITCLKMAARCDEYTQKLIKDGGSGGVNSRQTPDELPIKSELIEENRKEYLISSFERFWETYPRRQGKQPALKAWLKLKPNDALTESIVGNIAAKLQAGEWSTDRMEFIPLAATYLNQSRWEDSIISRIGGQPVQQGAPRWK